MKKSEFPIEEYYDNFFLDGMIDISCSGIEPYSLCELQDYISYGLIDSVNKLEYGESYGLHKLRSQLAKIYNVHKDCIIITNGASEALTIAITAVSSRGENVVIGMPFYNPFNRLFTLNGVQPQYVNAYNDGYFCHKEIEKSITDKTCAVILNNPNNPFGTFINSKIMSSLINKANTVSAKLIIDEVGLWLNINGNKCCSIVELDKKMIAIGSLSKIFGLPGLRVGWIVTSDAGVIDRSIKIKRSLSCSTSLFSQLLATDIITNSKDILTKHKKIIKKNINILDEFISSSKILECCLPTVGATCFPTFVRDVNVEELARILLHEHNYFIVHGGVICKNNGFRLGLGHRKTDLSEFFRVLESEVLLPIYR